MLTNGEIYTAYIAASNQTLRPQDERIALNFARAIEAAVLETQSLAGYSVMCDKEHSGNLFFSKQNAHHECDRLDKSYPGSKRQVVAVYSTGETHDPA